VGPWSFSQPRKSPNFTPSLHTGTSFSPTWVGSPSLHHFTMSTLSQECSLKRCFLVTLGGKGLGTS
jgi:hypothetical protein